MAVKLLITLDVEFRYRGDLGFWCSLMKLGRKQEVKGRNGRTEFRQKEVKTEGKNLDTEKNTSILTITNGFKEAAFVLRGLREGSTSLKGKRPALSLQNVTAPGASGIHLPLLY